MGENQKLKWYLQTWFIAILFAGWIFIIPPFVGLILLIMQRKYLKISSEVMVAYGGINELNSMKETLEEEMKAQEQEFNDKMAKLKESNESELKAQEQEFNDKMVKLKETNETEMEKEKKKFEKEIDQLLKEKEHLLEEKNALINEVNIAHYDFSSYESLSSQDCKNKLALLKNSTKDLIKNGKAIIGDIYSKSDKDNAKQIIRLFNAECDNVLLNLTVNRIDSSRSKITKSFESINKIFEVDDVALAPEILENKLEELNLIYTHALKVEQEKSIQKAIKEQMMEEEKAQRELEQEKRKLEKDQNQFNGEISRLLKYLQKADSDIEKQLYADKIKELQEKIAELEERKKDVEHRAATATAGYVYVISNIGSFGEDVYKIGMTRRLEPMDRIKELSSASVPFEFDVHAMIFAENAPELENNLHELFRDKSVNKVNYRKEFFKVSIDEIEKAVKEKYSNTVEFTKVPVATEYRETLQMEQAQ